MTTPTITDWKNFLREVCANSLLQNPVKIGGYGYTVEVDELCFAKRKYNVGRVYPQQWVFGGVCRETKECFLFAVPNRTAKTLLACIKECILPGTVIMSDLWKSYNGVANLSLKKYSKWLISSISHKIQPYIFQMETYLSNYVHQVIVDSAGYTNNCGKRYVTSHLTYNWQEIEEEFGGIVDGFNILGQPEAWYLAQAQVAWEVMHCAAAAIATAPGNDREALCRLCGWMCCQHDVEQYLSWAEQEPGVGSLLAVLHMTAALERALGNVFLMKNKAVPFLLRDLLQTEELKSVFNKVPMVFMQLVLGSPKGFNLRNVVWHGFLSPGELHPDIVPGLVVLIASLGQSLQSQSIPKRPQFRSFEEFHEDLNGVFPDITSESEGVSAIIQTSTYIPDRSRLLWVRAFQLFQNKRFGDSLMLLLPQLEHSLRMVYCQVNDCPGRLLTAESTSLYTTLDEILAPAQRLVVGEGLLMILLDLMCSLSGPRLRDRLSHGECDLSTLPQWLVNHVFCVALSVACQTEDGKHNNCGNMLYPTMQAASSSYRSRFHVVTSLYRRIADLLDHWGEWQHCPPPSDLPAISLSPCPEIATWANLMFHSEKGVMERIQQVSVHLELRKPHILFRPRAELELATALLGVVDCVALTADKLRHAAASRLTLWSGRALRSRARITCQRMWTVLPDLWTGLLCVLMVTTQCYQSLPLLAEHAQVTHRLVKAMNKTIGNTVTLCDVDKNRWTEAHRLMSTLANIALNWHMDYLHLLDLEGH